MAKKLFKQLPKAAAFRGPKRSPIQLVRAKHPLLQGSDGLSELTRRLGDARLAKRVAQLQQQFPVASVPELVVYDWLRGQSMMFDFQVQLFGGRGVRGGLIPDFVLYQNGSADVWQIQGQYWHALRQKGFRDERENLRMLGQLINGVRVGRVLDLWESDIYRLRPQIFYLALGGMELRG